MSIIVIGYLSLLLAVSVIAIIRYKKLTVPMKVLAWSVPVVLICNILSKVFSILYHSNASVLHIQSFVEFVFYSMIYYCLFKSKLTKGIVLFCVIAVTIFFFINAIVLQPMGHVFPTNIYLPTLALFTIFSLMLFRQMLLYPLKINVVRQSVFWFNTAMLFSATTMFFNLGMINYYSRHEWDNYIYYFWYFILYTFHIMIAVSLLTDNKDVET